MCLSWGFNLIFTINFAGCTVTRSCAETSFHDRLKSAWEERGRSRPGARVKSHYEKQWSKPWEELWENSSRERSRRVRLVPSIPDSKCRVSKPVAIWRHKRYHVICPFYCDVTIATRPTSCFTFLSFRFTFSFHIFLDVVLPKLFSRSRY